MRKMRYGNYNQVSFDSWEEYYYVLGFLANSSHAEIYWENNDESGAWGSEGRIHCIVPENKFPQCFRFTAGNGNVYARINCNEYVNNLISEHHFKEGGNSYNIQAIVNTVPDKYLDEFRQGYGGNIPSKQIKEPSKKDKAVYHDPRIKTGAKVSHRSYGIGTIRETSAKYVLVEFNGQQKKFQNPGAFIKGFLKIVED